MNVALQKPRMEREQFFDWAQRQDIRYEFDGIRPVPMTGGTINHNIISQNLWGALRGRLAGGPCRLLGPDAGLSTVGDAVRYPDALVTCAAVEGDAHTVPDVVVVFEVLSPTSGHTDCIIKVREYRAVPSIRRYIILEHAEIGLTVLSRAAADEDWTAIALIDGDTLPLPEIGIDVPVAEFYQDTQLQPDGQTR